MAKLATKHTNAEMVMFTDFTGGLNLSRPAESIADNEMQEATNFEYSPDTGQLRVRGGLASVYGFDAPVRDIVPVAGNALLVRAGNALHRVSGSVAVKLGEVEGDEYCSYEYWGDEKQSVIMAFGGPLYIYDGSTLEKIETEGAPEAVNSVFYRAGRVAVTEVGGELSDYIRYSGNGDPQRWTEGNDSDSVKIQVGYKDGCRMSAVAPIAGEILVFKSPEGQPEHGRIYRLQGEYPDWSVVAHSKGASAFNASSVASISNDLLFLTREGMASLSTATEFGDYKQAWAGAKVNPALAGGLNGDCRVWHLAPRAQVWVWDGTSDDEIWAYHYQIGGGAWTKLAFPGRVAAAASTHDGTYIGIGDTLYLMDSVNPDDDGEDIRAIWMPRTLLRHNQILLKSVMAGYLSSTTAKAVARVDRFELDLPIAGQGDIAATDMDIAYLDVDALVPTRSAVMRKRTQIRRWDITPELEVTNGMFSLSSYGIEIAEV